MTAAAQVLGLARASDPLGVRWLGIDTGGTTADVVATASDGEALWSGQVAMRPAAGLVPGPLEAIAVLDRGVPTIVVGQRSTADLAVVQDAGTVLVSYGLHRRSSEAVAAALAGAAEAPGRLSVGASR